jgi:hypothetical protein
LVVLARIVTLEALLCTILDPDPSHALMFSGVERSISVMVTVVEGGTYLTAQVAALCVVGALTTTFRPSKVFWENAETGTIIKTAKRARVNIDIIAIIAK